jgi:hypothetical protein
MKASSTGMAVVARLFGTICLAMAVHTIFSQNSAMLHSIPNKLPFLTDCMVHSEPLVDNACLRAPHMAGGISTATHHLRVALS